MTCADYQNYLKYDNEGPDELETINKWIKIAEVIQLMHARPRVEPDYPNPMMAFVKFEIYGWFYVNSKCTKKEANLQFNNLQIKKRIGMISKSGSHREKEDDKQRK